jgi:AraC-like DNA-binding protein
MNPDWPETTATGHPADGGVFLAYARGLFDYLREQGRTAEALLEGTGLAMADFEDSERSIPTGLYVEFWRRAVELTGDDCLGLHVGEIVRPGKYGILGYAMMSCETLREALLRQKRYQDLVGKAGRSEFIPGEAQAELRWYSDMARRSRQVGEEHVASWVAFARWMLGPDRNPDAVLFEHPEPRLTREHQRIFRCELRFGQPYTAIVFPSALLSSPIRDKDPAVKRLMDSYAENLLAERSRASASDPIQDIRDSIARSLVSGVPAIETIAEQMRVHTRTLQRRLGDLGLNYKQLLDDVRCTLALQYLKDPKLGLLDIAFLLGFAEQSSFQRAFKRWTGQSPGHYRGGRKAG